MQQIDEDTKKKFVAKRYMDDILVAYVEDQTWDHERFCADLEKSTCYVSPLKLEPGRQDIFLETALRVDENNIIRYKIKMIMKTGRRGFGDINISVHILHTYRSEWC